MIIIGHAYIPSKNFVKVTSIEAIKKTKTEDVLVLQNLDSSYEIAKYCMENNIRYAIYVSTIKDALFVNSLQATYMITSVSDASVFQPIAQEYLFDTRILAEIENTNSIEALAKSSIDGVIFKEAIG